MAFFGTSFYEPILAGNLQLDFSSDEAAYFYSIFTISNFLINLILILFPLQKKLVYWSSFAIMSSIIAALLMGPS